MINKNKRTIVQKIRSLQHYSFEYLDSATLKLIDEAIDHFSPSRKEMLSRILKLFECFLQVSRVKVSGTAFFYVEAGTTRLFIGALWSDLFVSAKMGMRYDMTRAFYEMLKVLKVHIPTLVLPTINIERKRVSSDIASCIKEFEALSLNLERIYYWQGWWAYNKNNIPWFVPLNGVYQCYSRQFTDRFFNQISMAYLRCRRSLATGISDFCRWLPLSGYSLVQLQHPAEVEKLFQDFLVHYLTVGYQNGEGSTVKRLIKRWRALIKFIEANLLGSIFVEPYGKLVVPQLHVTDEQAIDLLFNQIQADYDHVVTVAEYEAADLWQRYQRRKSLAPLGQVKPMKWTTTMDEEECQWFIHKNNPDWLANVCATFESKGFIDDNNGKRLVCSSYSLSAGEVIHELGLPKHYSLIPYMALLVAEHPTIVASFLTDFELYNKQGKLTGFVQLDELWVLDGRKRRCGAANAQQIVTLNAKSKSWVEQIIALTDCVRQYLKQKGDDAWRYLFLTSGKGLTPSRMCSQYAQAKKRVCGKAAYWSRMTEHLVKHIEQGSDHVSGIEFKSYLKAAREQMNPAKIEGIIYA